jgi:AcrR family transcriptional regulator
VTAGVPAGSRGSGTAGSAGRRRGRPAGGGNTREEVLAAARQVFAERGYEGATLRAIAGQAGVDPAMVRHFFGDKDGLFRAALNLPFDPAPALAALVEQSVEQGVEGLGERLVRFFLSAWEPRGGGPSPFVAFLRGAAGHEESRMMLHQLLTRVLFPVLGRALEGPDAQLRVVLCGSQMVGMGMARYVVRVEPLASLPVERLVRLYGPTLQRYLTGELPG